MRRILAALLGTAILALPAVLASDRPARLGDDKLNVQITLALADGESDRPIQALVLDGERIRTTAGWRVPVATAVSGPAAVQYQDIGIGVTLQARIVGPGRIRTSGEVDLGTIAREGAPAALPPDVAPTVATFRHVFDVIVSDGVPTILAEVPKPGGGSATLTLTAGVAD